MIKEYEAELNELKKRMEKAEKFAKRIPLYKDKILEEKLQPDDFWIHFGTSYKDMPLAWGINRKHFSYKGNNPIVNYSIEEHGEYNEYLFHINIMTMNLYGDTNWYDLFEVINDIDIFFIDIHTSSFYVTDENIEKFLETIYIWYKKILKLIKSSREDIVRQQIEYYKKIMKSKN